MFEINLEGLKPWLDWKPSILFGNGDVYMAIKIAKYKSSDL